MYHATGCDPSVSHRYFMGVEFSFRDVDYAWTEWSYMGARPIGFLGRTELGVVLVDFKVH